VNSARLAETYDEYFCRTPLFAFDCGFIARHLGLPRDPAKEYSVLDLGCGTGRHLLLCAENGCRAVGVDLNPHMLVEAKKKLLSRRKRRPVVLTPGHDEQIRLLRGNFIDISMFDRDRFDAALMMFSTLGLVEGGKKREEFLIRLRDVLRPGGTLILHVHNELRHRRPGLFGLLGDLRHMARRLEPGDHIQHNYRGELDLYLHYFTPGELRELIDRTGYEIKEFMLLNETRDGPLESTLDPDCANGFLVAAHSP
jgi:SAM-dependent methyltransferase